MPKLKPHKGLSKRVKVTGTKKILRHKANKGHLMASKTGARRRKLGKAAIVENAAIRKNMRRMLGLE